MDKPEDVFNQVAELYAQRFMDVSLYHETFKIFIALLNDTKKASILEVACGPGNITKYLLEISPELSILGTDIAPNMLNLAQKNCPSARFKLLDLKNINTLETSFDGILCGFGFPYISKKDTVQFIENAYNSLTPSGILYISTMENDYHLSGPKKSSDGKYEMLMYFHEGPHLRKTLEDTGFTIMLEKRIQTHGKDLEKVIDLILIARK